MKWSSVIPANDDASSHGERSACAAGGIALMNAGSHRYHACQQPSHDTCPDCRVCLSSGACCSLPLAVAAVILTAVATFVAAAPKLHLIHVEVGIEHKIERLEQRPWCWRWRR